MDESGSDSNPSDAADEFDPTAPEEREIGREMVDKSTGLGSVVAHLYRGEADRMTTWRQRLDQTTNWVVTLIAAILTWAFTSTNNPHYILLIGLVVVGMFAWIEARRYRGYDIFRSRVRMLQKNLFANALDPSMGIEERDWRELLSEDYHDPVPKLSMLAALRHRLRRLYIALLFVLSLAWVIRISVFDPNRTAVETAAIGSIPGTVVIGAVVVYLLTALAIAVWPATDLEQEVRGETTGESMDVWDSDEDDGD